VIVQKDPKARYQPEAAYDPEKQQIWIRSDVNLGSWEAVGILLFEMERAADWKEASAELEGEKGEKALKLGEVRYAQEWEKRTYNKYAKGQQDEVKKMMEIFAKDKEKGWDPKADVLTEKFNALGIKDLKTYQWAMDTPSENGARRGLDDDTHTGELRWRWRRLYAPEWYDKSRHTGEGYLRIYKGPPSPNEWDNIYQGRYGGK
jgi:hypothetical protein